MHAAEEFASPELKKTAEQYIERDNEGFYYHTNGSPRFPLLSPHTLSPANQCMEPSLREIMIARKARARRI